MKVCSKCKEVKTLSNFRKKKFKSGNYGLHSHCKSCASSAIKKWNENNPDKIAEYKSKYYYKFREKFTLKKYGLTEREYTRKLIEQNGVCAICNKQETSQRQLAVDHNHETGEIRGLLCGNCNRGLGHFQENLEILDKAKDYLTNWSKTH